MQIYILTRLGQGVLTLLVLSLIVFMSVHLSGDPALLLMPQDYTEADYQQVRENLGLNRPIIIQYATFLGNAVRGDFGKSLTTRRPARDMLVERIPATLQLAGAGMLLAIVMGIPLGILSAVKKDSLLDKLVKLFAIVGIGAPQFWVAIMLILVFGGILQWLPTFGRGGPSHFILPSFVLAWSIMAGMMRLGRSSMLEVLDSEFVKFARAKGLVETLVIWKHALRNAMIPLVTFGGISLAGLLNGTIVIEVVFAWPGVGLLMLEGVAQRNFPIVEATVLTSGFFYILTSLIVDILYVYIDPRIKYS
ncbi:MAG: ABC transporter permease [Chloroflexota bacterium]|nr:ABC transporter permease [Chloroflexota bacterium]|tara:strand:+ start:1137 stop:2054 length:918 start_codon:yes stop_codon:yes gene_type:complete